MILPAASIPLDNFDVKELLLLRDRINKRLPASEITNIDLEHELVLHFQTIKQALADAGDEELNKFAAASNAVLASLKQLAELQKSLYSASRLQKYERALAVILKKHPELFKKYCEELSK